jgi:hypothetical protein
MQRAWGIAAKHKLGREHISDEHGPKQENSAFGKCSDSRDDLQTA